MLMPPALLMPPVPTERAASRSSASPCMARVAVLSMIKPLASLALPLTNTSYPACTSPRQATVLAVGTPFVQLDGVDQVPLVPGFAQDVSHVAKADAVVAATVSPAPAVTATTEHSSKRQDKKRTMAPSDVAYAATVHLVQRGGN